MYISLPFTVCKEWLVREDNALAEHLQTKESKFTIYQFMYI